MINLREGKKSYPRNSDIRSAILWVLSENPLISPNDFPSEVIALLKRKGFYVGLVNIKRIWRTYENMVRKGEIYDILDVVVEKPSAARRKKPY